MSAVRGLTIIVTHYKTPDILHECLSRLEIFAKEAKKIVVDNNSQDDTANIMQRDFPKTQLIINRNHSMGHAVNRGLKEATSPFILQMNADVMLNEESIPKMLAVLQQPKVGMVGPRCHTKLKKWQDQGFFYKRYHTYLSLSQAKSLKVPWLSGCCQMVKRELVLQTGGMNTSLRFYNEDIEWCWRFNTLGYTCHLVNTPVLHIGGASTPNDPRFYIEGYRGGMLLSLWHKPQFYQSLHKFAVTNYARYQANFGPLEKRVSYKRIAQMFRANSFHESPFGPELSDSNPDFPF